MTWQSMVNAPRLDDTHLVTGRPVIGVDVHGDVKVIFWSIQYPLSRGAWVYAESYCDCDDNDGISEVQTFDPVAWMEFPQTKISKEMIKESEAYEKQISKVKLR